MILLLCVCFPFACFGTFVLQPSVLLIGVVFQLLLPPLRVSVWCLDCVEYFLERLPNISRTTSRYYVYIMREEGKIYIRKIYVPKENVSFTYFKNVQFHISCTCIEGLEHYQTFIRHTAISNNFTTVNIM